MPTLLEDFIERRKEHFIEPIRVNIPRGHKIGMSRAKHEAAIIIALCNFDLKKIAEQLHGSYEVIRKWRSEEGFKEECNSIKTEFISEINIELEKIATELLMQYSTGYFPSDFKTRFDIFKDADIFSNAVSSHIASELRKYLGMQNGHIIYFDMIYYIAAFSHISPRMNELLIQAQKDLRENIIVRAIKTLDKAETSVDERKEVIGLLQKIRI